MLSLVRYLVLSLLALSLIACGKSDEQKAADTAQTLVAEQNALALKLNRMPSSSWSDAELNRYEADLNRLAAVEAEIRAVDANADNVWTNGVNNTYFIAQRRMQLAEARRLKAGVAGQAQVPVTTWAPDSHETASEIVFSELMVKNLELIRAMTTLTLNGQPNASWERSKLVERRSELLRIRNGFREVNSELETLNATTMDQHGSKRDVIRSNQSMIDLLNSEIAEIDVLLQQSRNEAVGQ